MSGLCECGCGEPTPEGKRLRRGHWSRTPAAKAMYGDRRTKAENPNPSGLCHCGCGELTEIAPHSDRGKGWVKGCPKKWRIGHNNRGRSGEQTSNWKGGRWTHKGGYVYVLAPDHPRANRDGYVYEHRLVAEKTLGRYLTPTERVHHINGIKTDNRPENIVVMQTQAEHMRQHTDITAIVRAYHADNPNHASEAGRKGAEARWGKKP